MGKIKTWVDYASVKGVYNEKCVHSNLCLKNICVYEGIWLRLPTFPLEHCKQSASVCSNWRSKSARDPFTNSLQQVVCLWYCLLHYPILFKTKTHNLKYTPQKEVPSAVYFDYQCHSRALQFWNGSHISPAMIHRGDVIPFIGLIKQ